MRRLAVILGGVLTVLVVAGGAFYGGMVYERSQRANLQARFFAERGGGPEGSEGFVFQGGPQGFGQPGAPNAVPGQGSFGRGAAGTVKSIEGDTLLVSTPQDVTTVILNDQTVIHRFVVGGREDLQTGQRVSVIGERAQDGTITATSIQILAEQP